MDLPIDSLKVSIIIPVYNGGSYLNEAIDSALAQTYSNTEVIVINDGSSDDGKTEAIAVSYGSKIRYFPKPNGGVSTALNLGIEKMKGEYFSWLSHDDIYYPQKVQYQIDYLRENKIVEPVVLYSDVDLIDGQSKLFGAMRVSHVPPERFRLALLTASQCNGCTALVPKECFAKIGRFDESLRTTQDYDLWFALAQKYKFIHLPKSLVQSRVHDEQVTHRLSAKCVEEGTVLYRKMLNQISEEELRQAQTSPERFYFNCSLGLQLKGYDQAARYAVELLTKRFASKTPVYAAIGKLYYLFFGLLQGGHALYRNVR